MLKNLRQCLAVRLLILAKLTLRWNRRTTTKGPSTGTPPTSDTTTREDDDE
jgi:hypothetical protein